MHLEQKKWSNIQGQPVTLYSIRDIESQFSVEIMDFGATLVRLKMPDRNNKVDDIIFGQTEPDLYATKGYMGATIGRVANRIKDGHFFLEGKEYKLNKNNNNLHNLHGGLVGFSRKFWMCLQAISNENEAVLEFKYISPSGEEGFPGTLTASVKYTITPMAIKWEYSASTDAPTLCNLTNHTFWNLDGTGSLIENLELSLFASQYQVADTSDCPTGEIRSTQNSPLDFHRSKRFSQIFNEYGNVDNNFILDKKGVDYFEGIEHAATLYSPNNGRKMDIYTSEPCMQLYTGHKMDILTAFGGQPCRKRNAVCLETQRVVNAIQYPKFQNQVILRPQEKYWQKTLHKFSIQ